MRELWKKTALLASVGLAVGLLIGLGFTFAGGLREILAEKGPGWLTAYLLISGGMGMVNMGTVTIYEIERWSVTRCTLTHFAIALSTFCALGLFLGWFGTLTAWIMLTGFVIAYFIIWLFIYLFYKRQVRRINEDLKHWKDAQGEE